MKLNKKDKLKSFIRGATSIVDLWPLPRSIKLNIPNTSDFDALKNDWEQIGRDFKYFLQKEIKKLA